MQTKRHKPPHYKAEQKSGHFNWFNPAMRHQELRRTKQVTFIYMKTDEEAD